MAKTRSLTLCSRHAPPKQSAQSSAAKAAFCCVRAYLWWAFQLGGHDRPMDLGADSHAGCGSLHSVPGRRRDRRGRGAQERGGRPPRFCSWRFHLERLCRFEPRSLQSPFLRHYRDRPDVLFLIVILGATSAGAPAGFAGLAIGLALTLIHLISIRSATPRSIPRAAPVRRSSPAKPISNSFGSSCWRRSRAPLWPLSFAGLCRKPG